MCVCVCVYIKATVVISAVKDDDDDDDEKRELIMYGAAVLENHYPRTRPFVIAIVTIVVVLVVFLPQKPLGSISFTHKQFVH